jgi:2-haloacid dehalogenase
MSVTTIVFDAYGTLFDVAGAARQAATEPGGEALSQIWPRLADDWRRKQLEYTWLRAITGAHAGFDSVTADALDWALDAQAVSDPALRARLMTLYAQLPAYPEVREVLTHLKATGYALAILSNGTPAWLSSTVTTAGLDGLFDAVLSVEEARIYKPAWQVYDLVERRLRVPPQRVLFVSSNGWDVAGAARFGFLTAWVNRANLPEDRMPQRPAHTLRDLTGLPTCLS